MSTHDMSDVVAMSEDGDWMAFPDELTRGDVISAVATETSWWAVLRGYTVRRGYVREAHDDYWGEGWWEQCEAWDAGARRVWIVRRNAR
jgi:hypothetical protein